MQVHVHVCTQFSNIFLLGADRSDDKVPSNREARARGVTGGILSAVEIEINL